MGFDAPGILSELLSKNIVQLMETIANAHRAVAIRQITVVDRRTDEQRVGVARIDSGD